MSNKIYFAKNIPYNNDRDDVARCKESWIDILKSYKHNLDFLILDLAKKERGSGMFYCLEYGEIGDKGEGTCSAECCGGYSPRNGKSGICKHYINPVCETGELFKLTKDGKLIKIKE